MTMPPLDAFARAMTSFDHIEVHDVRPLAPSATLVRLTGWIHAPAAGTGSGSGRRWIDSDRITAVHRWAPELIGRSAGSSVRVRDDAPKGRRPAADVPVPRDGPLVQAALDRGLGAPLLREPLGHRATRRAGTTAEAQADDGIGLDYRAGHLVARVRSHEDGEAELAQLVEMLDHAHPLLCELASPPELVDAHYGPDKAREIAPGAENVEQARELSHRHGLAAPRGRGPRAGAAARP